MMSGWLLWCADRNLFIAVAAVMLSAACFVWLGAPVQWGLVLWIAAGAFLVYHLDRRLPFSPEDEVAPPSRASLRLLALAGALYAVISVRIVRPAWWPGIAGLALPTAAYLAPCLPGRRRIKEIPYVKAFHVALMWSLATVALPAAAAGRIGDPATIYLAAYRFVYLLPNTLLFDWPDREGDRRAGIKTLANRLPEHVLRAWCGGITLLAAAISFLGPACFDLPLWMLGENIGALAVLILLRRPLPEAPYFYRVGLDGLAAWPGVPALAFLLCGR